MRFKLLCTLIILISIPKVCLSDVALESSPKIYVCFTPSPVQNCTNDIINVIDRAQHTISVQAYSFTSYPIEDALYRALKRGVDIKIILDKSQFPKHSKRAVLSSVLVKEGFTLYIDNKPAIAHNKVMIIDSQKVITGSFNFTGAAQNKNAENMLIINDTDLAKKYMDNFLYRMSMSQKIN